MAIDQGPGIENKELAMRDGFSTKNSLGLGLPGARRLMDDFSLDSEVVLPVFAQLDPVLVALIVSLGMELYIILNLL